MGCSTYKIIPHSFTKCPFTLKGGASFCIPLEPSLFAGGGDLWVRDFGEKNSKPQGTTVSLSKIAPDGSHVRIRVRDGTVGCGRQARGLGWVINMNYSSSTSSIDVAIQLRL
jgi:hypothetical protein